MSSTAEIKTRSRVSSRQESAAHTRQTKLSLLQGVVTKRDQENLISPIIDATDFERKLQLMKRAYKRVWFDSNLRIATKHLYGYLKTATASDTSEYWKARTLLYELSDIFNIDREINEWTSNDGQNVFDELRLQSVRWFRSGE